MYIGMAVIGRLLGCRGLHLLMIMKDVLNVECRMTLYMWEMMRARVRQLTLDYFRETIHQQTAPL